MDASRTAVEPETYIAIDAHPTFDEPARIAALNEARLRRSYWQPQASADRRERLRRTASPTLSSLDYAPIGVESGGTTPEEAWR